MGRCWAAAVLCLNLDRECVLPHARHTGTVSAPGYAYVLSYAALGGAAPGAPPDAFPHMLMFSAPSSLGCFTAATGGASGADAERGGAGRAQNPGARGPRGPRREAVQPGQRPGGRGGHPGDNMQC